jgi:hypothetical protein
VRDVCSKNHGILQLVLQVFRVVRNSIASRVINSFALEVDLHHDVAQVLINVISSLFLCDTHSLNAKLAICHVFEVVVGESVALGQLQNNNLARGRIGLATPVELATQCGFVERSYRTDGKTNARRNNLT